MDKIIMTPPKATPDRKGKVYKPKLDNKIVEFTKVTKEELDRIEEIKRLINESKTTQED